MFKIRIGEKVRFACMGFIVGGTIVKISDDNDTFSVSGLEVLKQVGQYASEERLFEHLGETWRLARCNYKRISYTLYEEYQLCWWFDNAYKFQEQVEKSFIGIRKKINLRKREINENYDMNRFLRIITDISAKGYVYFLTPEHTLSPKVQAIVTYYEGEFYVQGRFSYTSPVNLRRFNKTFFLDPKKFEEKQ